MLAQKIDTESGNAVPAGPLQRPRTERVRILHLHAGNMYGGVETLLAAQARFQHLCPGLEPHFGLCFEGRLSRELISAGAPVHLLGRVRISRPWTVWRARHRLTELLRRENYDALVCHMPWPLAVFGRTARAEKQRLIFWAHSSHSGTSWLERMARRTTPDLAIATSRFVGSFVANLFPGLRTEALYAALPLVDTPEAVEWRTAVRREQGADARQVVILQVSRFEAWKGHLLHLEALSRLKTTADWVCWFVGGPQNAAEESYFRRVRETASGLGLGSRVRFLGQRTDVPRLLAGADIFCQPNQGAEPFGIVFVEALWAGCPVVTTALGGAREIVDPACGILTEPGDPAGLAAALQRLIDSAELRAQLGKAGPERARQLCDPATQLHALEELIREVKLPQAEQGGGR